MINVIFAIFKFFIAASRHSWDNVCAFDSISSIPWNLIYDLRNRIVHGYDGVDLNIVSITMKEDLPISKAELSNCISEDVKRNDKN